MADRYTRFLLDTLCIITLILFCTKCGPVFGKLATEKISLAFVIDDTNSMRDDIIQVISATKLIFNSVMKSSASRIGNFILVTFNDPGITPALITTNEAVYVSALSSIVVHGGGDCPEMAMTGIEEALNKGHPGSYVFVFTDASAKDYTAFSKIKSIAQKKSSQIIFVLTGLCGTIEDPGYLAYHQLAKATSGQVFHLQKGEVSKILAYVAEIAKAPRSVLDEKEFGPGYGKPLNYTTDEKTKDVMLALSGKKPMVSFPETGETKPNTTVLIETENILVVKINHTDPGTHTALVGSMSGTKAVLTGATTFDFKPGFSTLKPESIEDTATRPLADKLLYLAIETDDPDDDVVLREVVLLDMSGNILEILPLEKKDKDFYLTEATKMPNQMFKILVKGVTKGTKKPIKRLFKTPIEPQTLMDEGPVAVKAPTIISVGETLKKVTFNDPLELRCRVKGYPKPRIIWNDEKSGQTISEMVEDIDLPYDYVSVLSVSQVKTNASYQCLASNDYGADKKSVTVEAITKFDVVNISNDTDIPFGSENSLNCLIDSIPISQVIWYKNGAPVDDFDDIELSSDGSVLTIINMQPELEGKYTCEVRNDVKRQLFSIEVTMPDKELPKIEKSATEVTVRRNEGVDINCIVHKGVPQPLMRWFFKKQDAIDFVEIKEILDVHHIPHATLGNAGTYRCEAYNYYGKATKTIVLSVEYPPTIEHGTEVIKIEEGKIVHLHCVVDGLPKPKVTWTFKGDIIENSVYHNIYTNNTLRYMAAVEKDGKYVCKAVNKQGTARKTVRVIVYVPPKIRIPEKTSIRELVGKSITLGCEASGIPTPIVKWMFFQNGTGKVLRPTDESDSISLPRLQVSESGYYVCTASNSGGLTNLAYTVDVLVPPTIKKMKIRKEITAVVDDLVVEVPCPAFGNPKPNITWFKDGATLSIGSDWYDMTDEGKLIIKNVDKASTGSYLCMASNEVGYDIDIIRVNVLDSPTPSIWGKIVNLQLGEPAKLDCDILHRPTDKLTWYKDSKMIATGELTFKKVETSDRGRYTCRVNNFSGAISSTLNVIVVHKPEFLYDEKESRDFHLDEKVRLSCEARGNPYPKVSWTYNGETLKVTGMINEFTMLETNMGRYTCTVSNAYGTIARNFDIINTDCLFKISDEIDSPTLTYYDVRSSSVSNVMEVPKGETVIFTCPGEFIGFPGIYIEGTCVKGTTVEINNKILDASEIKCNIDSTKPVIKSLDISCRPGNTQKLKVGYEKGGIFVPTYDICYDISKSMPIYSTHTVKRSLSGKTPNSVTKWFENEFVLYNYDDLYDCEGQIEKLSRQLRTPLKGFGNCCYARKQLVNPRDVSPGLAQKTTYSTLNVVPHWSTCNSQNWDEVEKRIRSLSQVMDQDLLVHTGISEARSLFRPIYLTDKNHKRQRIPVFIWKVVQDESSESSLAIIQINIPNLTPSQTRRYVRCKDICWDVKWMRNPEWRNVEKGFIYCCAVDDFERAFRLTDQFSLGMHKVLYDRSE